MLNRADHEKYHHCQHLQPISTSVLISTSSSVCSLVRVFSNSQNVQLKPNSETSLRRYVWRPDFTLVEKQRIDWLMELIFHIKEASFFHFAKPWLSFLVRSPSVVLLPVTPMSSASVRPSIVECSSLPVYLSRGLLFHLQQPLPGCITTLIDCRFRNVTDSILVTSAVVSNLQLVTSWHPWLPSGG